MSRTRGVLFIHSSPAAMCPHIEWAVGSIFGAPVELHWVAQSLERASFRCEFPWLGPVGTSAKLASAFRTWKRLRFEASEEATSASEGERYSYTPTLGLFRATTGLHGDIMIPEDRLRAVMATHTGDALREALDGLLGTRWDEELEPFRFAHDTGEARWLHEVASTSA